MAAKTRDPVIQYLHALLGLDNVSPASLRRRSILNRLTV